MVNFGKIFVVLGIVFFAVGLGFILLERTHFPLGRLPGDVLYRGKNTTFYFPIATSILVSVVLTVLLYVIGKFRH